MKSTLRALAFALTLLAGTQAYAAFGGLYAFGDSLTDSGNVAALGLFEPFPYVNLVPGGAYPSGTFSNGAVWSEILAGSLGLPLTPSFAGGTNFAVGGAKTGALPSVGFAPGAFDFPVYDPTFGQSNFAAGLAGALPSDGLYVLNGGGNDIREALTFVGGGGAQANAFDAMTEAVDNLMNAVGVLAQDGATTFAVSNLPDVSFAPAIQASGGAAVGLANALVLDFNMKLATEIPVIEAANPGIDITLLDTFSLFDAILAAPGAFGFTNTTDPCTLQNGGTGCADPSQYVFWDGLHPTSAVQQLTADAAFAAVVPVPAAVWLFGTALAALGAARRRAA